MKTITGTIYMAEDGEKFLTKAACKAYEDAFNRTKWINTYYNDFERQRREWERQTKDYSHPDFRELGICFPDYGVSVFKGKYSIYISHEQGRVTLCNLMTGQSGKSNCPPKDFDMRTGIAIAWARYRGEKVPDYI